MSTISNVQEAREALCNGELFQVGGRFINPRDIMEVDPNGGTDPIFRLEDGRTVQHNRFTPGDVGDYLAAALDYAQRESNQSEAIKPTFNRLLIGEGPLTDGSLSPILSFDDSGLPGSDQIITLHITQRKAYGTEFNAGSSVDLLIGDLDDGTVTTVSPPFNTQGQHAVAVDRENGKVYYCGEDGTDALIGNMNLDGSNPATVINMGAAGQPALVDSMGVLPNEGVGYVAKDSERRFQLDGSGETFLQPGGNNVAVVEAAPESGTFFGLDDSTPSTIYEFDPSISVVNTFSLPFSPYKKGLAKVPGERSLITQDSSTDEIKKIDLKNGSIGAISVLGTNQKNQGLDAGVKL